MKDVIELSLPVAARREVIFWLRANRGPQRFYLHSGWHGGELWSANAMDRERFRVRVADEKTAIYLTLKWL